MRAGSFLGGLLVAAVIALSGPVGSVSAADRDCADFPNRSAAQTYFDGKGGSPANNVDRLDADHDGLACEENPCPCAVPGQNGGRLAPGGLYSFRVEDPLDSTHSEGRSDLREIAGTYNADQGSIELDITLWRTWQVGDRVDLDWGSCLKGPRKSGLRVELFPMGGQPFEADDTRAAFARSWVNPDVYSQTGLGTSYSIEQASPQRQHVSIYSDAFWHRWLGCLIVSGQAVEGPAKAENTDAPEVDRYGTAIVVPVLNDAVFPTAPVAKSPATAPTRNKPSLTSRATLLKVIDADTVKVRASGKTRAVRLLGIDAPEASSSRSGPPNCGGASATRYLKKLLKARSQLTLTSDPSQGNSDRHGRLLRYVSSRGKDLSRALVSAGWATPYKPKSARNPARLARYKTIARQAKKAKRGVWRSCGGRFHKPA